MRDDNLIKKPTLPISLRSVSAAIQFVYVSRMSVRVCENTRSKSVTKCEDDDDFGVFGKSSKVHYK